MENIKEKLKSTLSIVREVLKDIKLDEDYIYDIRIVTLLDDDNPIYQVRLRNSFDGPDLFNIRYQNLVAEVPYSDDGIETIATNIEHMTDAYPSVTFEWFSS